MRSRIPFRSQHPLFVFGFIFAAICLRGQEDNGRASCNAMRQLRVGVQCARQSKGIGKLGALDQ
jgi:hypothetical protein